MASEWRPHGTTWFMGAEILTETDGKSYRCSVVGTNIDASSAPRYNEARGYLADVLETIAKEIR